MKKHNILSISFILSFYSIIISTDISMYGSNPYSSYIIFPQDIFFWNANCVIFYPIYEQRPYWGDIDEPENKPNASYTNTGIKIIDMDAKFYHTAQIYSFYNQLGYTHAFPIKGITANLNLAHDWNIRYNRADGNISDISTGSHIPFNYSMNHTLNYLDLKGIVAFNFLNNPSAIRLNIGFENTLFLYKKFEFTKNGTSYSTERAAWGWTTSPCAHIFGATGPEGDAWLQNEYALGPVFHIDLQAGTSLPLGKISALFSYRTGHQDYYTWVQDTINVSSDPVINQNFIGKYEKDEWRRISKDALLNACGNFPLLANNRFSLNSFLLIGYEGAIKGRRLDGNNGVENSAKDKMHSAKIEIAPNIMISSGDIYNFFNGAVRLEYSYSRLNNTYLRWVEGGQIESYRDSKTDASDEYSWQGFSYANKNVLDLGIDLNTMLPLFISSFNKLGLGILFIVDSKFSFINKYYGQNTDIGSKVNFNIENIRKDFEREFMFKTGLRLQYSGSPFLAWIELTEPILHSILPRTRVTDASGKSLLYEHEKEPLWLSLEGLRLGLYVSYELTLPFLR